MTRLPLRRIASAMLAVAALSVASTPPRQAPSTDPVEAGGLAKSAWPKFHRDPRNHGEGPASHATGFAAWTFHTNSTNNVGGEVWSSPALGEDGTVYVGSNDHNIYALNGANGALKWMIRTGGQVEFSSPAVAFDGTVLIGSSNHYIYCLSGTSGVVKWTFLTDGPVWSSPTISPENIVYVGSNDGNLYALDLATGKKKWSFKTGGAIQSSPALGSSDSVCFGSDDHHVYALNRLTGEKRWMFTTGKNVVASPAIGNSGTVFIGSLDHYLYALNGLTGKKKWSFDTGGAVTSAPAIGTDGSVYVGCAVGNLGSVPPPRGMLYALVGKNGTKKWSFQTGSEIWSSPALSSSGLVYFGSSRLGENLTTKGALFAVKASTGAVAWTADTGPGSVLSSPAIGADGTVYVGSDAGNVIAFR